MTDTARRATLTAISEARGKYTFSLAGDLDALEWVWILEHAKRRVMTEPPLNVAVRTARPVNLRARKVS